MVLTRGYLAQGNCDTGTVLVLKMIKGFLETILAFKMDFLN